MTFDDCTLKMGSTDVSAAYIGTTLVYSGGTQPIDYSTHYLTFVAQEDGTFRFAGSSNANALQYSLDDGDTWQTLANNTDSPTVYSGDSIMWKGSGSSVYNEGKGKFSSSGLFEAQGNAMSLYFGDNFTGQTSLSGYNFAFKNLFKSCKITSAKNLIFPSTNVTEEGYRYMFSGCTNITTAPELPATTLANNCYQGMFIGCTSLTSAPELPATTLASSCYQTMFYHCTSLTTAPELPATTLAGWCYGSMFNGCTSLNYIKCLATSGINTNNSTYSWVNGVSSTGTFVKDPNATWPTGDYGIPTNWTVQDAT